MLKLKDSWCPRKYFPIERDMTERENVYVCMCVCVIRDVYVCGYSKDAWNNIQSQAFQEPWKSMQVPFESYWVYYKTTKKQTGYVLIQSFTLGCSLRSEVMCHPAQLRLSVDREISWNVWKLTRGFNVKSCKGSGIVRELVSYPQLLILVLVLVLQHLP